MKSILGLIGLLFLALSTVDAGHPGLASPNRCWFEKQNGHEPVKVKKVLDEKTQRIATVTITGADRSYISDNVQYWKVKGKEITYEVNCNQRNQRNQRKTGLCKQIATSKEKIATCPVCRDTSFTVTIGTTSRDVYIPCVGKIKHAEVCETKSKKKCFTVIIGNGHKTRRRLLQGADGGC